MRDRGWTPEQVDEAVASGSRIDARNKSNGNPATRYVNSFTQRSVVIDNVTNSVVQIGADGFEFGEGTAAIFPAQSCGRRRFELRRAALLPVALPQAAGKEDGVAAVGP